MSTRMCTPAAIRSLSCWRIRPSAGVSLTGSEGAGAAVAKVAAENLKKSVLELGGSDPFILLDSADLDRTTTIAARARLSNAGQACNSPKRFIVTDELYDDFVRGLVEKFEATAVGGIRLIRRPGWDRCRRSPRETPSPNRSRPLSTRAQGCGPGGVLRSTATVPSSSRPC